MKEARAVLPTDILALVPARGRAYKNEAWPRERLGSLYDPSIPLSAVIEQALGFLGGHSAWISVERQRLRGLLGARRRGGSQAWEIDYLIDATKDLSALPALLDCAVADVGRSGAEKLFLRLATDSDLLPGLREGGFIAFQEETVYALPAVRLNNGGSPMVRPLVPADSYLAYRLYNSATPEAVRRNEAATYAEWHAAQERRWLKGGVELVSECDGRIEAVVRAAHVSRGVVVDILAADAALDDTMSLIGAAVHALGGDPVPIYVMCAATSGLAGPLETAGFEPVRDFVSLMKRTVRPMPLPKLTPAVVKPVVSA